MVSQMSDKYDRKNAGSEKQKFEADHVISYFKMEWKVLLAVTVSGLIYNLGLLAGPWFEGKWRAVWWISLAAGQDFLIWENWSQPM